MELSMAKVKSALHTLKGYWSKPPEGRYLPFKEIAAYGVGGMGIGFIVNFIYLGINAQVLPLIYGISATHATLIVTLVSFVNLLIMPWFYNIFDNLKSKRGKFRTFTIFMAPIVAGFLILSCFAPQFEGPNRELISTIYAYCTCIPVLCLSAIWQNIFNMMPTSMTPNSQERTDMLAPASIVFSFAPTLLNVIWGPVRDFFQKQNQEFMAFRIMGIVFALLGCAMAYFLVFGTKQRVYNVSEKKEKIKFFEGVKKVFKNRPYLVYLLFTTFGVVKLLISQNFTYIYNLKYSATVGIGNSIASGLSLVTGFAATPAMILVPILTRKFSKKTLAIFANILSGAVILIYALIGFGNIPVGIWSVVTTTIAGIIFNFCTGMNIILNPAMMSDLYDYQQYKTGDRLEGFMSTVGGYVQILGTAFTFVPTLIMENVVGFLPGDFRFQPGKLDYDPELVIPIFNDWMNWALWISLISTVLCIIPLFFYTLTEKKHKEIMEVIKSRAVDSTFETQEELQLEKEKAEKTLSLITDEINELIEEGDDSVLLQEEAEKLNLDVETSPQAKEKKKKSKKSKKEGTDREEE